MRTAAAGRPSRQRRADNDSDPRWRLDLRWRRFRGVEAAGRLLGDLQKPPDQHARPSDLVRLRGRRKKSPNGTLMLPDDAKDNWAQLLHGRRARGIAGDENGADSDKASACKAPAILRARASATGSPGHARTNSALVPPAAMSSAKTVSSPGRKRRAQAFTPTNLFGECAENRLPIVIIIRAVHPRLRFASEPAARLIASPAPS